jgi:hypothetical protein
MEELLARQLQPETLEITLSRDTWQEILELIDVFNALYGTDRGRRLSMELHELSSDIAQMLGDEWSAVE